jgi:hypothetical protein
LDLRKICYKKCIHSNNLHENNLASICRFGELVEHLLCLQNFWIRKNRGKMPRIANFPQVMKFRGLDDCFANHFISTNRQCLCFRSRLRLSLTNPEWSIRIKFFGFFEVRLEAWSLLVLELRPLALRLCVFGLRGTFYEVFFYCFSFPQRSKLCYPCKY